MFHDRRSLRHDTRFEAEKRSSPLRFDVHIEGALREPGQTKVDVVLENLSRSGFRCDYSTSMNAGDKVWVAFAGLTSVEAVLSRHEDGKCGFSFVQPLNPAVMDHIVSQYRKA